VLVVDELFFFRVPSELSTESYGDIVQMADGIGANGCVHGADCLPSALDTFDEIPAVIVAARQADLIGADRCGQ